MLARRACSASARWPPTSSGSPTIGRRAEIPTVAPAAIAALPIVSTLPVATFPQHARRADRREPMALPCAHSGELVQPTSSNTVVLSGGLPSRDGRRGMSRRSPRRDGEGPTSTRSSSPAVRSAYVRSARIVGDDGSTGARFLVTDAGVVFGIRDDDAATFLGSRAGGRGRAVAGPRASAPRARTQHRGRVSRPRRAPAAVVASSPTASSRPRRPRRTPRPRAARRDAARGRPAAGSAAGPSAWRRWCGRSRPRLRRR